MNCQAIVRRIRQFLSARCVLPLVALTVLARPVLAQTEMNLIKESVFIPPGETQKFQFGTVPQAGTTVLLTIKARMNYKELSGSLHFMKIRLNGFEVQGAKNRFVHRLVNKPLISPVQLDMSVPWYMPDTGTYHGWNVLYAPNFNPSPSLAFYTGDPFTLVLDVTDLTNPVAENRLEITNTITPTFMAENKMTEPIDLVIRTLKIETRPEESPIMKAAADDGSSRFVNRGEPAAGPARYQGKVLPGGGFTIAMDKNTYCFDTGVSYPNAGFNRLNSGAPVITGQKDWKVAVQGNRVTAQGPNYTLSRVVKFLPQRVEIEDTFTNSHKNAPLGLSVRNEMDLSALTDPRLRIAGNPDPTITDYYSFGNPSVYVGVPEGGIGVLAEDDVFRYQARLYVDAAKGDKSAVAGIRTDMLWLAPGASYTLRWAVYPVGGPDYYDFINLVRADWGANRQLVGSWWWFKPDLVLKAPVQTLTELLKRRGTDYLIAVDWVDWGPRPDGTQRLGLGLDVFNPHWAGLRKDIKAAGEKLRQADLNAKIFGYFNASRESADDVKEKYGDFIVAAPDGQQISTRWTHLGDSVLSYSMVPSVKNAYGQALLASVDRYIDEMNLDGIYWDEAEGVLFGQPHLSYNIPDGHSCFLDPKTWTIQREVGMIPLISKEFRLAVDKKLKERGKLLLINGPMGSLDELRAGVLRMTEIQHNNHYGYEGLLQPPLGYMSGSDQWVNFVNAIRMGYVPGVSINPEYNHEIAPFLFPFTPVELHSGYLLGRERIIAEHSGNYGWKGEKTLSQARFFDANGRLQEKDAIVTIKDDARTKVELADNEAVVIERIPVTLETDRAIPDWQAEISQLRYDKDGLALTVKAPRGGVLTIGNGKYALKNGDRIPVKIGDAEAATKSPVNGSLQIRLPSNFNGEILLGNASSVQGAVKSASR